MWGESHRFELGFKFEPCNLVPHIFDYSSMGLAPNWMCLGLQPRLSYLSLHTVFGPIWLLYLIMLHFLDGLTCLLLPPVLFPMAVVSLFSFHWQQYQGCLEEANESVCMCRFLSFKIGGVGWACQLEMQQIGCGWYLCLCQSTSPLWPPLLVQNVDEEVLGWLVFSLLSLSYLSLPSPLFFSLAAFHSTDSVPYLAEGNVCSFSHLSAHLATGLMLLWLTRPYHWPHSPHSLPTTELMHMEVPPCCYGDRARASSFPTLPWDGWIAAWYRPLH